MLYHLKFIVGFFISKKKTFDLSTLLKKKKIIGLLLEGPFTNISYSITTHMLNIR